MKAFNMTFCPCVFCVGVLFFLSVTLPVLSSGEKKDVFYVRSVQDLETLALLDVWIAKGLQASKRFIPSGTKLYQYVNSYLKDFTDSHGAPKLVEKQAVKIISEPTSVYRLVRRCAYLRRDIAEELRQTPDLLAIGSHIPTNEDVNDAIDVILRIQLVYNKSVAEFAEGHLNHGDNKSASRLNAAHLYEIGSYAKGKKQYTHAHEWLTKALELSFVDQTVDVGMVKAALHETIWQHDIAFGKSNESRVFLFIQTFAANLGYDRFIPKARDVIYSSHWADRKSDRLLGSYWDLCSGVDLQTEALKSLLFCWLEFKIHPTYTISPLKMEFLNRDPDIVQIYQMFSESELGALKLQAGKLWISKVIDLKDKRGNNGKVIDERTSASKFLEDSAEQVEFKRKAAFVSGLRTTGIYGSENIQVASYSVGGHYEPHVDSLIHDYVYGSHGDRIATFMVYVSDVQSGGFTVFPNVKAAARPVKGSAVLWFNTYGGGDTDYETIHGACPVMIGRKWVANHWIRANDQFLVRKCPLEPSQRHRIAVNGMHPRIPRSLRTESSMRTAAKEIRPPASKYIYTSAPQLQSLANLEWRIYHLMLQLIKLQIQNKTVSDISDAGVQYNCSCVTAYLTDIEESSREPEDILQNAEKYKKAVSSNVIAAFKMYHRFWNGLRLMLTEKYSFGSIMCQDIFKHILRIYNPSNGPTEHDMNDAMQALINIQFVHDLRTSDIASGIIFRNDTGIALNPSHCLDLSSYATKAGYFSIGVEWAEMAVSKLKEGEDTKSATKLLEEAVTAHDMNHKSSEGWEPYFYHRPLSEVSKYSDRKTRKLMQYSTFRLRQESNFIDINYWGICQGRSHQSPEVKSKLFCWYEKKIHPSWLIGPLKAELLSMNPHAEIVQYHEIISDALTSNVTDSVSSSLIRAAVSNSLEPSGPKEQSSKSRLSAVAWIHQTDSTLARHIGYLIERVTGLKVLTRFYEELMISSYTPGSLYTAHMDSGSYETENKHARIATFMIYLSDTQLGGATAFSQAGIEVRPKKGSALFWHNLLSSGQEDEFTFHGACPLIFGEKWIANKWIKYDQQTHLQCSSDRWKRTEVLVNGKSKYY